MLRGLALATGWVLPKLAIGSPLAEEAPAVHNWMLVGDQAAYLSHLPMFEKLDAAGTEYITPHRFQVILQVSLGGQGGDLSSLYFADRRMNPSVRMFTVSPSNPFVLPEVAAPSPLTTFQGTVFRGHLERGGRPIAGLHEVAVNIRRVVHFHKFDPAAATPATLEYLLFGSGTELFLAHAIIKPPDFDQIVSVKVSGSELSAGELESAIRISIPLKKNSSATRLEEGENAAAELADGRKIVIQAVREFYFEEGELMMPATFKDTPEERKSSFST